MTAKTPAKPTHKDASNGAQPPRMTKKLRAAVHVLATTGKSQTAAAEEAGMNVSALSRALARPEVRNYLEHQKAIFATDLDKLRKHGKAIAYRVAIDLLENSKSDQVKAKMVEFFAGEARGPAVAVQINNPAPAGYEYRRPDLQSGADDAQDIVIKG